MRFGLLGGYEGRRRLGHALLRIRPFGLCTLRRFIVAVVWFDSLDMLLMWFFGLDFLQPDTDGHPSRPLVTRHFEKRPNEGPHCVPRPMGWVVCVWYRSWYAKFSENDMASTVNFYPILKNSQC